MLFDRLANVSACDLALPHLRMEQFLFSGQVLLGDEQAPSAVAAIRDLARWPKSAQA